MTIEVIFYLLVSLELPYPIIVYIYPIWLGEINNYKIIDEAGRLLQPEQLG